MRLRGGEGMVKTLYLQCVESLIKNKIELKTFEHVSVIEQTFDLQILSFVWKLVQKNMEKLVELRKLEIFLSLNLKDCNYIKCLEMCLPSKSSSHVYLSKYLLENYDSHLFQAILFYKYVRQYLNVWDEKLPTLRIIQNCRQLGRKNVLFYQALSHQSYLDVDQFRFWLRFWGVVRYIEKEKDVKKKFIALVECYKPLDINWCVHKETLQLTNLI